MRLVQTCMPGCSRSKQLQRLRIMFLLSWKQLTWPVKTGLCAILLLLVLTVVGIGHLFANDGQPSTGFNCEVSSERRAQVVSTAHVVSRLLTDQGIGHALCYGSLWGALRTGGLLPYEDRVQLCSMNTEMSKLSTPKLKQALSRHGLSVSYSLLQGRYIISSLSSSTEPDLVIYVFHSTAFGEARQCGLQNWLRSLFNRVASHAFPSRLLAGPLQTLSFEKRQLPVPNGDAEILKYMNPDYWWTESLYSSCAEPYQS